MNTIIREKIITDLATGLKEVSSVYAFWLEGSDGTNTVDEYSDIDICVDVEDGEENNIFSITERILSEISTLDFIHEVACGHPKLRQKHYHLTGTSEYLIIDFNIQLHSRDANESSFIRDSSVEIPKVIFDKRGVVRFRESDSENLKCMIQERIYELKNIYGHHSRVIKYVKRGLYIEAYGYYQKYVVTPLVELLRLKYTPDYSDYYIVHISHHIPKDVLSQLEKYFKVSTVNEIYDMTLKAGEWFNNLYIELEDKNS